MFISLCVCRLSRQRGWASTQATVSAVFRHEQGWRKSVRQAAARRVPGPDPRTPPSLRPCGPAATRLPSWANRSPSRCLPAGGGYRWSRCRRTSLPDGAGPRTPPSIQSEGSPPVSITMRAGYFRTSARMASSVISTPSSWCVSQKGHFRLHPEKRTNTAGVPVWKPSPCRL